MFREHDSRWRLVTLLAGAACLFGVLAWPGCEKLTKRRRKAPGTAPAAQANETAHATVALTDEDFKQLTGKGVTLVDFWATWCGPCVRQGPIVEDIAKQYLGRATVGKLDVDANRDTAGQFGVRSIPTLIVFRDGKEVQRLVGLQSEETLRSALDAALRAE